MTITVLIHMEPLDSGGVAWWAESPEVPGFSATAESLVELRVLAAHSIVDLLAENGQTPEGFRYRLVGSHARSAGDLLTELEVRLGDDGAATREPRQVGPEVAVA
jgi:hypothetical protein